MICWTLAVFACFAAVLIKYDENHVMLAEPFHWSTAARAAHEALYRPLFALGLFIGLGGGLSSYGGGQGGYGAPQGGYY